MREDPAPEDSPAPTIVYRNSIETDAKEGVAELERERDANEALDKLRAEAINVLTDALNTLASAQKTVQEFIRQSLDPNDKIGPTGFGPAHFISADQALMPYRIDFENDATATAPAQRVAITDHLSTDLDWNSFALTEVGFSDTIIAVPPGSQHFQTSVSMTFNGITFDVQIEAGLRLATGEVFATFESIDPLTSLPPDILTGFLPPEDGTGRGQGHISYVIQTRANLSTGSAIRDIALIKFDDNEVIATNQVNPHNPSAGTDPAKEALVTIDAGSPNSTVAALPTLSRATFTVSWAGSDDIGGSGVASYDGLVSDNSGPFAVFLSKTQLTSTSFTGVNGHSYSFASVARDNVGHEQATPITGQSNTQVDTLAPTSRVTALPASTLNARFTMTWSGEDDPDGSGIATYDLYSSTDYGPFTRIITGTRFTSTTFTTHFGHTYSFYTVATDQAGNRQPTPAAAQASILVDRVRPPSVSFKVAASQGAESITTVNLVVTLSSASSKPVTVRYAISGGTAAAGADYTGGAGKLTIAAGQTSKSFTLRIINDVRDEDNETIQIALSQPLNAILGARKTHTYNIVDNDLPPTVAFSTASSSGLEAVGLPVSLMVRLSTPSGKAVTVNYVVSGGSAASGIDYELASGSITFAPGQTSKSIPVRILNNSIRESNKTVQVKLASVTNAGLGTIKVHTYTILNDDA